MFNQMDLIKNIAKNTNQNHSTSMPDCESTTAAYCSPMIVHLPAHGPPTGSLWAGKWKLRSIPIF